MNVPVQLSASPWRKTAGMCALIFAATLAAYFPSLKGNFLWNDGDYVTAPKLQSLHGLERIWFEVGATQQYYPLLHTAFWVEHRWWGEAPLGYHLANILWHALAACLLALTLRRLTVPGAWLAGAIFALHPVTVESVAWITEQKNTLSAVFYLLAALTYLRFDADRSQRFYFLALALFLAALLTKTTVVTLPAVLLVALWWQRGRLSWAREVRPLLPWFALAAGLGLFSSWVERRYVGAEGADFAWSATQRVLIAGRVVWFYLGKLLWPANLVFVYPKWMPAAGSFGQWLFPLGAVACGAVLWRVRGWRRAPLAAGLCFVGTLFPVLGFFNFYGSLYSFVADHWQYLPCMGIIAFVAGGIAMGLERLAPASRAAGPALGLALLAGLGTLTWRQCTVYRDLETLYRTTLAGNPDCWMAQTNLGNELMRTGRWSEAIEHLEAAVRLLPASATTRNSLGVALTSGNRREEAIAQFEAALQVEPNYPEARNNLADALARTGRVSAAIAQYEETLRLTADYAPAHNNLANLLAQAGRNAEATAHYREALRRDPNYAEAQYNFGNFLREAGDATEAVAHEEAAVRLKPAWAEAREGLGGALLAAGRRAEAVTQLEEAVRLKPDSATARNTLGVALASGGDAAGAIAQFGVAVRISPDFSDAHYNLGLALRQTGREEEARVQLQRAKELQAAGR